MQTQSPVAGRSGRDQSAGGRSVGRGRGGAARRGLQQQRSGSSSSGKTTITELDYFTSSGGNAAVNWYNKQFEAAHPNITVKRRWSPTRT